MLFLGIISWKGASCFNEGGRGGGVFQMGASFLRGGVPHGGGIGFGGGGGGSKKL